MNATNSNEPDFAAQTSNEMDPNERTEWLARRATEAAKYGATYHRYSLNEDNKRVLYEGWKKQPETMPEPHYFETPNAVRNMGVDNVLPGR